ncbi:unnamed protein product [Pleuronectes platessa]|uniref:Uncharacterized protein n=1 Tax=Pleuronectes platessa TaxID=8262 RepID=A0A9N7Z6Y1_PLEPL|nr:unnamed protein product [Pleuronectes platessa]
MFGWWWTAASCTPPLRVPASVLGLRDEEVSWGWSVLPSRPSRQQQHHTPTFRNQLSDFHRCSTICLSLVFLVFSELQLLCSIIYTSSSDGGRISWIPFDFKPFKSDQL